MRVRGVGLAAGAAMAVGCNVVLGDLSVTAPDATTMDDAAGQSEASAVDGSTRPDATSDATLTDALTDAEPDGGSLPRDAGPDAACAPGLTACSSGCVALDAATNCGSCGHDCTALAPGGHLQFASIGCSGQSCTYTCAVGYADCVDSGVGCATNLEDASTSCGACGHDCHGGSCSTGACGVYVIAAQPTTGNVAKLATDGTRVIWADTGISAIEQIGAAGGAAITLAGDSLVNGAVNTDLALARTTVAFSYGAGGTSATPSVGLARVDVADSGVSVFSGALLVEGVSLSSDATHVFYVDRTGMQANLNDCLIGGPDAGACNGVSGGGLYLQQTAADDQFLFFDVTSADIMQTGLYLDAFQSNSAGIFDGEQAQSLAVDGRWAYWTSPNDGGVSYTLQRTLESSPGTDVETEGSNLAASAFATDGVNVYYWTGSAIVSRAVAGGTPKTLASVSAFVQIAVGGGLLVWTDGATIWGLVL